MNVQQFLARAINTTPHPITFAMDGELVTVPPSHIRVNATPVEKVVAEQSGVQYVETVFESDPETEAVLQALKGRNPDCIIVGSIIAAQAYPGLVCAMTPMPGFERVPVEQKRMNPQKFTVWGNANEPVLMLMSTQYALAFHKGQDDGQHFPMWMFPAIKVQVVSEDYENIYLLSIPAEGVTAFQQAAQGRSDVHLRDVSFTE